MSHSDQIPRIPLHIRAADLGTEIFLVDDRLNRINTAIGEMHTEVVSGLYKIRFRSGGTMQDHLIEVPTELPPGQREVLVQGPPLQFASAMPLVNTRTSHEYQQRAWPRASLPPDMRIGSGAFLFVLARDPEKLLGKATSHRPWNGLSLHSTDDTVPALGLDFSEAPYRDEDPGVATAHLEVNPGTYLLRVDTGLWGIHEMAVHASAGWQTQIFLSSSSSKRTCYSNQKNLAEPPRTRTARRVDLNSAAVLMVRPGNSVDPSHPQWRLTELARQGLAQNRETVRAEDLRDMLWAKFDNPMLGLFGATLMLRSGKSGGFLQEVVGNLSALLPDHPDVAALRLAVGIQVRPDNDSQQAFPLPPMLLENWKRLIQSSIDARGLIPADSPSSAIGGNYYSEGPWLVWRRSAEVARAFKSYPPATEAIQVPQLTGNVRAIVNKAVDFMSVRLGDGGERRLGGLVKAIAPELGNQPTKTRADGHSLQSLFNEIAQRFDLHSMSEMDLADKLTPTQFALVRELQASAKVPPDERGAWLVRNLGIPEASLVQTAHKLLSTQPRHGTTRKK
ncbi:MAG: hypothetical protein PHR30_14995 [Gallionellaceae bacterium]|nr:hypothetical protein [Gallionellaceae bacterium]